MEITDILNVFDLDKSLEEQIDLSKSEILNYLANENIFVTDLKEIGSLTTKEQKKIRPKYSSCTRWKLLLWCHRLWTWNGSPWFSNRSKDFWKFLAENNIPVRPAKKKIARMFERKQQIAE